MSPTEMEQQALATINLASEISDVLKSHSADAEMAIGVLGGLIDLKISDPEILATIDADGRQFLSEKLIEMAVALAGGGRN